MSHSADERIFRSARHTLSVSQINRYVAIVLARRERYGCKKARLPRATVENFIFRGEKLGILCERGDRMGETRRYDIFCHIGHAVSTRTLAVLILHKKRG